MARELSKYLLIFLFFGRKSGILRQNESISGEKREDNSDEGRQVLRSEAIYTVGVDVLGDPRRNGLIFLSVLLSEARILAFPSGEGLI